MPIISTESMANDAMTLPPELLDRLRQIFGSDSLVTDEAERVVYGYDNSRREATPDAVVFPVAHEQVVALVTACRAHRVPLIARGRGTNTTGATVPTQGGIVASFERMNRVLSIDPGNRIAIVEPGVTFHLDFGEDFTLKAGLGYLATQVTGMSGMTGWIGVAL